jgi:hypothetical protein
METYPDVPLMDYDTIRPLIRTGDLLLCSGTSLFSKAIQRMTNSCFSHVAFLLRAENIDRVLVVESVESIGVQTVPMRRYLVDYAGSGQGYPGRLWIARHVGLEQIPPDQLMTFSQGAVDLFGTKYDTQECLGIFARIVGGQLGLAPRPSRTNRTYICSEYAALCYQSIGLTIPYDPRGFIAPKDFAICPEVTFLWELAVPLSS